MLRRSEPAPGGTSVRNARILGLVVCAAGFAVIALGWNAVSGLTCVDCQLPYVLSAGAGGVGLVVFGVGVLLMAEIRAARIELTKGASPRGERRSSPEEAFEIADVAPREVSDTDVPDTQAVTTFSDERRSGV
jgi:hypothetical protein